MIINVCFSLFITGIIVGSGPCLLSCGPILLSYIAGTKRSAWQGLRCWAIFSFSRLLATIFLGFMAAITGTALLRRFYWEISGYIIWGLTGVFIVFLGTMVFIGLHTKFKACNVLGQTVIRHDFKSLMMLGILVGLLPCVPLIGVLSYITMVATHYAHGILMGAAFGLGTIVSPLVFASIIAGAVPGLKIFHNSNRIIMFQRICGIVLIVLGSHIVIKTLMEFVSAR
ncbi:MAG: sulfite exporter TauE/SafE family protein [Dehalococcoidia bacterium]|nr:MAG: sulfite exporter TauE/SafE family protein [Dehalococcoidia bacterium]